MDNTLSKFIKDFQDLTLKEWQGEMAAVKQTLNDIVVLLQSTNEKITKISEAIATSNGDNNNNNNNNHNNNNNNNQSYDRMLDRSMEVWYGTNRTNDKKQCEQQQKQ